MRRILLALVVFWCRAAAGCTRADAGVPGEGLPFYDSPDFTPRWARSSAHAVGAFALVDQMGAPFTHEDMRGRIHVASFIFTRCGSICPTMVRQLARVQQALESANDVVIVSYSVTPQHDTPEILAAFGAERRIDPDRWKLLTGDVGTIYRLARESYFADDGRVNAALPATGQFLHTEKLLLVDGAGRLRGVYNGTLPYEIDKLLLDVDALRAAMR